MGVVRRAVRRVLQSASTAAPGVHVVNIIFGIIMIVGGASGELALIGTDSSGALVLVGVGVTAYGIYQVAKRRSDSETGIQ